MEIERIRTRKIYEEIAERIKEQIVSGSLRPGDKLPSVRELSERFQVGRSTVREALSALKAMGLVTIHQGEGSYVRSIDADEVVMPDLEHLLLSRDALLELLEVRKALESSNAAIAAVKRTAEDLEAFEAILANMEDQLGDEKAGEQEDLRFHLTLAQATHNSIMVRLFETISSQMEAAIRETRRLQMYGSPSVSKRLWQEHRDIYEAVREGDGEKAQASVSRHLYHVEQVLLKFLRA